MLRFLLIGLLFIAAPNAAHAQEAWRVSPVALALFQVDCGMQDGEEKFRRSVLAAGPALEADFLRALDQGAPPALREASRAHLAAQHEQLAAHLRSEAGARLVAQTGAVLAPREAYIADGLASLEQRVRENSVRGLGLIGGASAPAALSRAREAHPSLSVIIDAALAEISARSPR